MIARHEPYEHILATMFGGNSDLSQLCMSLESRKADVRKLRKSFHHCNPEADYSQAAVCDAYMLSYYPYYIDTVHRLLHTIEEESPESLTTLLKGKTKITVSLLGTGPSPELLGLVGYLAEHQMQVESIEAILVDVNTPSWKQYRMNYTMPLIEKYGKVTASHQDITCDLLACECCKIQRCTEFLGASDIVIMQNCVTDLVSARNKANDLAGFSFLELFLKLHRGALFLVIDLDYDETWGAINEVITSVQSSEAGRLLCRSQECQRYRPEIEKPDCLKSLFDGSDGLIMKENTKYHYAALQRIDDEPSPTDWIETEITRIIDAFGFKVDSVKTYPWRRRYNLVAGDEKAKESYIDIIYNGKDKITKLDLHGRIQETGIADSLRRDLIGKQLVEIYNLTTLPEVDFFEGSILKRQHDDLVEQMALCAYQVQEIRHFQYMVRYKISNSAGDTLIFDRYYNARNRFTRTIIQSSSNRISELWAGLREILNVQGV